MIAHPLFVFTGTWSLVFLLYGALLSGQLIYDASEFLYVYWLIILGFLSGYFLISLALISIAPNGRVCDIFKNEELFQEWFTLVGEHSQEIWRRVVKISTLWLLITIFEIFASGGLPILWLITGSDKTYMDFGISSVHGLTISMLLSSAIMSFFLYFATNKRRYLFLPVFALTWFIVAVTRAYIIGLVLEMFFLYILLNRITLRLTLRFAIGFCSIVLLFGIMGDFRSGSGTDSLIISLGRPTEHYPEWLPSGFLWAYLYITTPLNNLLNTISQSPFSDSYSIASTFSGMFPSVIRNIIFSGESLSQGDLVDESLNISGAFLGPYLDFGLIGITAYSAIIGIISALFWLNRYKPFYTLGYAFVATTLFLTLFYNAILALPYLIQLIWFWWFLRPCEVDVTP
jgi:oligosaccharide repeat unit polymerase